MRRGSQSLVADVEHYEEENLDSSSGLDDYKDQNQGGECRERACGSTSC
jgi:hypothetical protein